MFFGCLVISELYLFQETVLLNPCFTFFKNLMLSFNYKVTIGTKSLGQFISNLVLDVSVATAGSAPPIADVFGILYIMQNLSISEQSLFQN